MSKNVNMRIEGKKCPAGQESSDQGGPDAGPPQGFGGQGLWGATQALKRKCLGCYKSYKELSEKKAFSGHFFRRQKNHGDGLGTGVGRAETYGQFADTVFGRVYKK
jgi:hypothetical protein